MCGVQLKDRKISTDLIFMLGLKETIDQYEGWFEKGRCTLLIKVECRCK